MISKDWLQEAMEKTVASITMQMPQKVVGLLRRKNINKL
jgi:hypothetical protein